LTRITRLQDEYEKSLWAEPAIFEVRRREVCDRFSPQMWSDHDRGSLIQAGEQPGYPRKLYFKTDAER